MIKIPIELYNRLMQNTENTVDIIDNDENMLEDSANAENKPIKLAHKNMKNVSRNVSMPGDVKQMRFNQEFKRAQKFSRDKEEKPINVRVQNLSELAQPQNYQHSSTNGLRTRNTSQSSFRTAEDITESISGDDDFDDEVEDTYIADETTNEKLNEITKYVLENRKALGVNSKLQVIDRVKGRTLPLKTSNVMQIVKYHLQSGDKPRAPTGYKKFLERCESDNFLKDRLKCISRKLDQDETQNLQSTSNRVGYGLKPPRKYSPIRIYGVKNNSFKPSLWQIKK